MPEAEMYFKGDRGLFAYKPHEFLYWAGVAYKIQMTADGKEYIFMHEKPVRVQIFESTDKKMSYIHVGEAEDTAQGSKIPREKVLEAQKTPESILNLKEAKELFSQLQGSYHGDHKPPTDFVFKEVSPGNLCLSPSEDVHIPLQLIDVHRDINGKIDELHMTWSTNPPDKMLKFIRNENGTWGVNVTGFLAEILYETCAKTETAVT